MDMGKAYNLIHAMRSNRMRVKRGRAVAHSFEKKHKDFNMGAEVINADQWPRLNPRLGPNGTSSKYASKLCHLPSTTKVWRG